MKQENSILFLGDVVPYKPFKFKNRYKTVFNLECPITAEGEPVQGKINLKVTENYLSNIFQDNILCVNISNNHILDYGEKGLKSTLSELKRLNLPIFGLSGDNPDEYTPLIVEFADINIAFFSVVCPTTSPVVELGDKTFLDLLDVNKLISGIAACRKSVEKIVVYLHWGAEESSYPSEEEILTARKLIDAGADIILGSHAHAPQAIERYQKGIIAYNLGNFIMPKMKHLPSYYDERGIPLSTFNKHLMLWNRVSWGLVIDVSSMEYKVKKYIYLANRIIELPFTPLDKYIKLHKKALSSSYENILEKHMKRRLFQRKIKDFIHEPYVPQKFKKLL